MESVPQTAASLKKPTFADVVAPKIIPPLPVTRAVNRFKGLPSITFSEDEVQRFSVHYQYSLISSFWNGRPTMKQLISCFERIDFKLTPKLGLLDEHHILITFTNQDDYQRCFYADHGL